MNLTSKSTIKKLLRGYSIRPTKRLGQNFLIDKGTVKKIINAADLGLEDVVLEIGPGIGTLTQELAQKTRKVIAVEKDPQMVKILGETLKGVSNVKVIREDIRKLNFRNYKLKTTNYKLVGNLPFYLTAPVIRKFLENTGVQPRQMVLVVQKEVGQRICAKPSDMNLLAVSVQFYSAPKILFYISKKSFWPRPEVDAAIIKITPTQNVQRTGLCMFFKIVRAGFSQPRKQLINNLSKGLKIDKKKVGVWLLKNEIQPTRRAQTLSIEDWIRLVDTYQ